MSTHQSHDAHRPSLVRAVSAAVIVTALTFCCIGSVFGLMVLVALRHTGATPTVTGVVLAVVATAILAVSAKYGSMAWRDERHPAH